MQIPIIEFQVKIVNPHRGEQIIDPTSGIADFLSISYVNSDSALSDENVYGVDNDTQMVMLAQLNMLLNGDGNAKLYHKPDKGSIIWKFDDRGAWWNLIQTSIRQAIGTHGLMRPNLRNLMWC
ncbi:MAG: N-6 DNA methylase [Pseudoflavonifractor sp.]|nr:N-6 DNA methylase [Pseudoflavonifractor sp.]